MPLLMRGTSGRRSSMATRAAPSSSASAALSTAEAPAPITPTVLPRAREIDVVAGMRPVAPVERTKQLRYERPAEPVAAGRQHHAARRDALLARLRAQREDDCLRVAGNVE